MGRIYQQKTLLKNPDGTPRLDADGRKVYALRSKYWWVQYQNADGKTCYESSESERKGDAAKLLRTREAGRDRGEPVGPTVGRITFDEGVKLVTDDYKLEGRDTLAHVERRIKLHLAPVFGGRRMTAIGADDLTAYAVARKEAGASSATVNRELAIVKRAFRLGQRAGRLIAVPHVPMLEENNVRRGFFERSQFLAVRAHLPAHLQPVLTFTYYTGWRLQSEVLALRVGQVDLKAGIVRLEPGTTKNDEGRQFDFSAIAELKELLTAQVARAERLSKETGKIVSHLFTRDSGKAIRHIRKAWINATTAAGCPGRIPHDLRRTAIRNMERAGIPRVTAKSFVGHRTDSVYTRYAIVDEAMQREASAKMGAYAESAQAEPQTAEIIPMAKAAGQ